MPAVHLLKSLATHVGVYFRGADARVSQHLLDDAQVGAMLKEVSRKAMSKHVGRYVSLDPSHFNPFFDVQPKCGSCKRSSAPR